MKPKTVTTSGMREQICHKIGFYRRIMNRNFAIPEKAMRELCSKYGVRELSVFGSALRSDFNDASDIELLVEFLPDTWMTFPKLLRLEREFAALTGRKVDLVP